MTLHDREPSCTSEIDRMFGFIVGAACLAGLVHMMRHRRCYGRGGWGHHHFEGHEGHHRHGWGRGWDSPWEHGGGRSGPFWLRGLFSRLDTTPGQEKVIREVVDELREEAQGFRGELGRARGDLADALRSDTVDETALGEAFARHDDALTRVRKGMVGGLAKLHEALDERQRRMLAQWLESRGGWGGPYRGGAS
jgi:Spy/CpxP family protein refolding chaperone